MRILLWAPLGAGTHYWGPGTSAYRLYKINKDKSVSVTLIHASDEQGYFPDVFDDQVKLPTFKGKGIIGMLRYMFAATTWIRKNYKKYDVVHGIGAYADTFTPVLQLAKLKVPVFIKITGEHGGFGDNGRISRILGISKNRIKNINNIDGYIAISSMIKRNLLSYNVDQSRIFQIPNGVDSNLFKPITEDAKICLRKELNIKNVFTFMYVGGMTYNKRIIEIVKAVSVLKDKNFLDFQFIIVGPDRNEGLVEREIMNLIRLNKLEEFVIIKSQTNTPELYFQVADVFMLVSKTEGMSNSLLEAMSTGLPSIVTDVSGTQDLICENIHGIYTSGEVKDLAEKMESILKNRINYKQMGKQSRKLILEEYSNRIILDKHISLFSNYTLK